jgi:hypothetical protein
MTFTPFVDIEAGRHITALTIASAWRAYACLYEAFGE